MEIQKQELVRAIRAEGAEPVWRWIEAHPGERVDLSGADLSGVTLMQTDLRGANLAGVNFKRAWLFGSCLDDANLADANLSMAMLAACAFNGTNLSGADLTNANLSEAFFDQRTILTGSQLDGANLWGCRGLPAPHRDAYVQALVASWRT